MTTMRLRGPQNAGSSHAPQDTLMEPRRQHHDSAALMDCSGTAMNASEDYSCYMT